MFPLFFNLSSSKINKKNTHEHYKDKLNTKLTINYLKESNLVETNLFTRQNNYPLLHKC